MGKVQSKEAKKMPLGIAQQLAKSIVAELRPYTDGIWVCGSIRRKRPEVADIDLVAWPQDREQFDIAVKCLPGYRETLWSGDRKLTAMLDGTQVDFMFVKEAGEVVAMMLHFTGSAGSNIALRGRAKAMGLKLNEYGLYRGGERLICLSEEDIYKRLNLTYVPPEGRN